MNVLVWHEEILGFVVLGRELMGQISDIIYLGWSTLLQMASVQGKVKPYLLNSLFLYPGSLLSAEKSTILVRVYNSGKAQVVKD